MNPVRQNFMSQVMAKLTIDRGTKILNEESDSLSPEQVKSISEQINNLKASVDHLA